jgi:hypothetical protein
MRITFVAGALLSTLASATMAAEMKQDAVGVITLTADASATAISFEYQATRCGMYQVDVPVRSFSKNFKIRVGDQKVAMGESVYIAREGKITIAVDTEERGLVQSIQLTPAPEGKPIEQAGDGSILLHARDATVHGTALRYEPAPEKNTLGYWVNHDRMPAVLRPLDGLHGHGHTPTPPQPPAGQGEAIGGPLTSSHGGTTGRELLHFVTQLRQA